jgi:hypothetical protein
VHVLKYYLLLARPAGEERAAFQERFLRHSAPDWLAAAPWTRRLIVNLVDEPPPVGAPADEPPCDTAVEGWYESGEDFQDAYLRLPLDEPRCTCTIYLVRERIQLDREQRWPCGERSPGVKVIYLVRRNEALSDAEARQRWREHAPLAKQHHAGMVKYVQNAVVQPLSLSAPVVHGIAELHFPTRQDLEQRMYGSAEGRAAIAADTATLVAESTPLYASEYILKS